MILIKIFIKLFRPLIILPVCFFVFFFAPLSFSQPEHILYLDAEFSKIVSIESDFIIERQSKAADKPIVSKGKFYYQAPDKLRWEYVSPKPGGFLIDGGTNLFWRENKAKIKVKDVSGNKRAQELAEIMLMFISMNIDEIEKTYQIEQHGLELKLTPKNEPLKSSIKNIIMILNEKPAAVKEVIILSVKNSKTLIMFLNPKTNQKLSENVFKL